MAAAAFAEEDDLLTCSVCWNIYDEEVHKPKFLSCHHTLCLECIKSILVRESVVCPLCRQTSCVNSTTGMSGLQNNPYALQMVRSQKQDTNTLRPNKVRRWCFKCSKIATEYCNSFATHTTIAMGSSTPQSMLELQNLKNANETNMAEVIEKRRETKSYLSGLVKALKAVENGIKLLEEENDLHLVEMISLLESGSVTQNESAQSFAKKVKESSELLKQELIEVQRVEFNKTSNTRILLQFKEQEGSLLPSLPIFQQGFSFNDLQSQPNQFKEPLGLVSYILFSILNENSSKSVLPVVPSTSSVPPVAPPSVAPSATSAPPATPQSMIVDRPRRFSITTSYFEFSFSQHQQFLGRVLVRPDPDFSRRFLEDLARFCHSRQPFSSNITKAHPASFAAMEFDNVSFQPTIPGVECPDDFVTDASEYDADEPLDVGLWSYKHVGMTMTQFDLVFLIDPDRVQIRSSALFGRVAEGEAVIEALSRKRINQRDGFVVDIIHHY